MLSNILEPRSETEKVCRMDLEKLAREMRSRGDLNAAAESPEGKALARRIDDEALRTAAQRGDTAALKTMLSEVLSSPEGKALAERVQKAVGKK